MDIIRNLNCHVGSLENIGYDFINLICPPSSLPYRQLLLRIVLSTFNTIRAFTLLKIVILRGAEL